MTNNINTINELVAAYKQQRNPQIMAELLKQFMPLIFKYSKIYAKQYVGVHEWQHVVHEAQVMFCELVDEYIIGGSAYFTVFVERKLPFKLRYFFVKEIRRRTVYLSHSWEQIESMNLPSNNGSIFDGVIAKEQAQAIWAIMQDRSVINKREFDILFRCFWNQASHQKIADMYNISRPRITQIVRVALQKIKKKLEETACE